ncbi:DUF937 domain-containing protein [Intrasporangium sp. YIM S08009]|uniref:DUF937 domain-containing protein n=1 Tax=Intrasporangium zincisolvens TaxID=3080018 RepID=UPI002B0567D2|nr:DUF937 domain-containing protein [Intrasporangium sp. YIM S08009]
MSSYEEILSQVPVDELAQHFGVEPGEIEQAAQSALPALLGGLHANAGDPAGASSLLGALGDHQEQVGGLDDIDEGDGQRIVGNIFGDNTDQVVSRLGSGSGSSGGLVGKLLPILAPIVLSWLANRIGQGGLGGLGGVLGGGSSGDAPGASSGSASGPASSPESGPLFPGGQGAGSAPVQPPTGTTDAPAGADASGGPDASGSNPLQDILGQVLGGATGGSSGSGAGGVLGGILGGLLGGGRR